MNITMQINWNDIFFSWNDYYQGILNKNTDFARAWEALPRFICWKILTTRNTKIFEGKNTSTNKVAALTMTLWVENHK